MERKLKQKWIDALRSGKYKQGKGRMKRKRPDGYRFCCLGVLEDVLGNDREEYPVSNQTFDEEACMKIGLSVVHQRSLTLMNDGSGNFTEKDFFEISDWIRENV